jgi:hypothetical protein
MIDYTTKPSNSKISHPQLTSTQDVDTAQKFPFIYEEALIRDIIINEEHPLYSQSGFNVGQALIRFKTDFNKTDDQLSWANPIESNIQEYPLKNEVVLVYQIFGQWFYTRKINVTRKITQNSFYVLNNETSIESDRMRVDKFNTARRGAVEKHSVGEVIDLGLRGSGKDFIENRELLQLKHFAGDLILQGRFGNSIRFGSSMLVNEVVKQSPNLIMRVGQNKLDPVSTSPGSKTALTVEDINKDDSSIWIVSEQAVNIQLATSGSAAYLRPFFSYPDNPRVDQYVGNQIVMNSDRILINSRRKDITMTSNYNINLNTIRDVTIDTNGQFISYSNLKRLHYTADHTEEFSKKDHCIVANRIFIGTSTEKDSAEPLVLGYQLAKFLFDFIQAHVTFAPTHVLTAMGPGALNPALVTKLIELQKTYVDVLNPIKDIKGVKALTRICSNNSFVSRGKYEIKIQEYGGGGGFAGAGAGGKF